MGKNKSRLGIIDWGIGAVGIYALIKSQLGNVPVVYFSDTGVTPYGKMSRPELISRLDVVLAFLRSQEVSHLVVGCNAASTVLPFLKVDQMKVAGVIESAIRVTERMRPARLALIGGRRTVLSGVYRRAFAERGIPIKQRIGQALSARIEDGDLSSTALRKDCQRILSPLNNCSHLLLACTHYPAIVPVLRAFVSPQTVFIDPADELIRRVAKWRLAPGGADSFFTSGEPEKMQIAASKAFGTEITAVKKIGI